MKFEVLGKVVPKQSARFTKSGFAFTPKHVTEYANWVRLCFQQAFPNHLPSHFGDNPLKVNIDVFIEIPKSYSKTKHERCLRHEIRPVVKPDCDNYAKQINDALNGLAYADDKQIVELTIRKFYGEEAKMTYEVEECMK